MSPGDGISHVYLLRSLTSLFIWIFVLGQISWQDLTYATPYTEGGEQKVSRYEVHSEISHQG